MSSWPSPGLPGANHLVFHAAVVLGGVGVSTPDAGEDGLDPLVMLHAVLGTPETLADYKEYLLTWPDPRTRMRMNADGTMQNLGRRCRRGPGGAARPHRSA